MAVYCLRAKNERELIFNGQIVILPEDGIVTYC
jgi:hypothetical protein